jgi:hypothetical protein
MKNSSSEFSSEVSKLFRQKQEQQQVQEQEQGFGLQITGRYI